MDYISEVSRVRELMGLINESNMSGKDDIYYMKCEGGEGLIDPESYVISNIKTKDGKQIISFVKEPNPEFNNGDSKSIPTCLGMDIPFTGRCWSVGESEGRKMAWMEVDCETGVDI